MTAKEFEMTLPELSRRVSESTGQSRELDGEVARAIGWSTFMFGGAGLCWKDAAGEIFPCPPSYTASLDAVVALIAEKLPGRIAVTVEIFPLRNGGFAASCSICEYVGERTTKHLGSSSLCKTEPLARLSAALLAIHERNKSDDNR